MILPRILFTPCCTSNCYTAEASDLINWQPCPHITVVSDTCEATFQFLRTDRTQDEDNEIQAWEYVPTAETLVKLPRLQGWKVVILND